jgi:hypothetical protein
VPQAQFEAIRALPEGHRKTVALAAWFQGLFPPPGDPPVLVGGAAAEIFSGGAYTTGDLDFVGEVSPTVGRILEGAGFVRHGRHWVHEAAEVFIELPGSRLEPSERAVPVRAEGYTVLVLSPEDVLVDRLAAWQFWRSPIDGIASFWIWRNLVRDADLQRLEAAASRRQVQAGLASLRTFAAALGARAPDEEELTRWAKTTF